MCLQVPIEEWWWRTHQRCAYLVGRLDGHSLTAQSINNIERMGQLKKAMLALARLVECGSIITSEEETALCEIINRLDDLRILLITVFMMDADVANLMMDRTFQLQGYRSVYWTVDRSGEATSTPYVTVEEMSFHEALMFFLNNEVSTPFGADTSFRHGCIRQVRTWTSKILNEPDGGYTFFKHWGSDPVIRIPTYYRRLKSAFIRFREIARNDCKTWMDRTRKLLENESCLPIGVVARVMEFI